VSAADVVAQLLTEVAAPAPNPAPHPVSRG
jgi:hypothetical protein